MTAPSSFQWPLDVLVALTFTDDLEAEGFGLSPEDRHLIEQAISYAQWTKAKLTLLHVIEEDDKALPEAGGTLHGRLLPKIKLALDEVVAQAAARGVEARRQADIGEAWSRILAAVKLGEHDMVLVGPREQGWFEKLTHGDTTRKLLRKCPVPVWVEPPQTPVRVSRVLVPVDFSPLSARAIEIAEAFHALTGAERVALHCPDYPNDIALHRMPEGIQKIEDYHAAINAEALDKLNAALGEGHEGWRRLIGPLPIAESLTPVVKTHGIDLVIMGTNARSGLMGLLLGNTAEKILDNLEAPVLVFKPEGRS